jgi:hypothetical protein
MRVAVVALLWSLWLSTNDMDFNAKQSSPTRSLSLVVVYSSETGKPFPIYDCMLAVGASDE